MAGVMEGRRFKFSKVSDDCYEVGAVLAPSSVMVDGPVWVGLGFVVRGRRSTDTKVGRFRRPGKGAVVWSAKVPLDQGEQRGVAGVARLLVHRGLSLHKGRWELEVVIGQRWDRREDAALALAAWYDQRQAAST